MQENISGYRFTVLQSNNNNNKSIFLNYIIIILLYAISIWWIKLCVYILEDGFWVQNDF